MTGDSLDFDGVESVLWTESRDNRGFQELGLDEIYPTSTISSTQDVWKVSKTLYQVGVRHRVGLAQYAVDAVQGLAGPVELEEGRHLGEVVGLFRVPIRRLELIFGLLGNSSYKNIIVR